MAEKKSYDELQERINQLEKQMAELKTALSEREVVINRLEKDVSKQVSLIKNAPLGIFRTTSRGQPIWINRALGAYLGFDSTDEAIQHYQQLGSQLYVDPERTEQFLQLIAKKG